MKIISFGTEVAKAQEPPGRASYKDLIAPGLLAAAVGGLLFAIKRSNEQVKTANVRNIDRLYGEDAGMARMIAQQAEREGDTAKAIKFYGIASQMDDVASGRR